jgi:hypothetical protein
MAFQQYQKQAPKFPKIVLVLIFIEFSISCSWIKAKEQLTLR